MQVSEFNNLAIELENWLRMRFHPVAVKMLKEDDEIPKDAIVPTRDWKHKFALCQAIARSQRNEETITMLKNDNWCFEPVIGLGLVPFPQSFENGTHRYPDSVRNLKAAAEWGRNMPRLPFGEYKGIILAPANKCKFIPEIIVMHVNGLMATMLTIIKNWIDGKDINCQISGHAACVYAIVPSILKGECNVAFPCKGDRRLAFAQDDEIIFTLPTHLLRDFIEGIRNLQKKEWGLPILVEMKEEYDLKLKYKEEGENLGLDLSTSPPRIQKYEKY